jgi:hypothetical protein
VNLEDSPQPTLALARIGERYLKDLQTFGRLSSVGPLNLADLTPYAVRRAVFIIEYFTLLQTRGELRLSPNENLPFHYNLRDWPSTQAMAGYCGSDGEVTASSFAMSLLEGWDLRTTRTLHARLIKAALWRAKDHGLSSALALLFDLYHAGFSGRDELREVAELLLLGRCSASSDDDMVQRFLNGFTPDAAQWHSLIPATDWIRPVGDPQAELVTPLLEQAAAAIQRVRGAADFDEWNVGQIQLHGLLLTVSQLVMRFCGTDRLALTWKTRLAQWEEIEADAFSFLSMAAIPILPLPIWDQEARSMQDLAKTYRDRGGGNWKRRFCQERLRVPDELRDLVLDTPEAEVPQRWRSLSRRVIRPWLAAFRDGSEPDDIRATSFPPDKLVSHARIQDAMRELEVEDPQVQVSLVRRMLATELDTSSAGDQRIIGALNDAIAHASAECAADERLEGFGEIRRLHSAREYGAALTKAQDLLRAYPYSKGALHSVARLHEIRGNLRQALDHLVDTVALEPMDPQAWRSLAGVLHQLGNEREAELAAMCGGLVRN